MALLFNLDFRDDYAENPSRTMSSQGYLQIHLSNRAAAWFTLLGCAFLLMFFSWVLMQRIGKQAQKAARDAEREHVQKLSRKLDNTTSKNKRTPQMGTTSASASWALLEATDDDEPAK